MDYLEMDAGFSEDRKLRFTLYRRWRARDAKGFKEAIVAMLNPSAASHLKDDPTIRHLTELLDDQGYGGYTVVNWSPFITSKPNIMMQFMRTESKMRRYAMRKNIEIINKIVLGRNAVAAWGDAFPAKLSIIDPLSPYTTGFIGALTMNWSTNLHCFGTTRAGAPKHPLARGKSYIHNGTRLAPWIGASEFA